MIHAYSWRTSNGRKLHIMLEETKDGLNIEIVDQDGRSMFPDGSKVPFDRTRRLIQKLAGPLRATPLRLAIANSRQYGNGAGLLLSETARELALGMVPPEGLQSHIREAVEAAGAQRIGHGGDIAHEQVVLSSEGHAPQRAFRCVVVQGQPDIIEKPPELIPMGETVADGANQAI